MLFVHCTIEQYRGEVLSISILKIAKKIAHPIGINRLYWDNKAMHCVIDALMLKGELLGGLNPITLLTNMDKHTHARTHTGQVIDRFGESKSHQILSRCANCTPLRACVCVRGCVLCVLPLRPVEESVPRLAPLSLSLSLAYPPLSTPHPPLGRYKYLEVWTWQLHDRFHLGRTGYYEISYSTLKFCKSPPSPELLEI